MTRSSKTVHSTVAGALFLAITVAAPCAGAPASSARARTLAQGWLRRDARPMRAAMSGRVNGVRTFRNVTSEALYHVVAMQPEGFVVVSADDQLEPVVAFSARGHFRATEDNPLYSLLQRDMAGRLDAVRNRRRRKDGRMYAARVHEQRVRERWAVLESSPARPVQASRGGPIAMDLPTISDVRVAPFVTSTWGQSTVSGLTCYNYYTPNNYLCGCVATVVGQLMRYYRLPTFGVGTPSFNIWVDGVPQSRALRGGDGIGGPYNWAGMPLNPDGSITLAQRQAIGALIHDAGVAVNMSYSPSGSAASIWTAADRLVTTFGYANAVRSYNWGYDLGAGITEMLNPNLDAGYTVILSVRREGGGHAVLCDGYGFQDSTPYHHLNMGWSGLDDSWYNLPDVDAYYHYTSVDSCVYNLYPQGSGEIISGRVTDATGTPMAGITVSASAGGAPLTAPSNANGIYAIESAVPNTVYTVSVSDPDYEETNRVVSVGLSADYAAVSGNRWGIDFALVPVPQGNRAPQFDAVQDQQVRLDQQLLFTVSASDPDQTTPALAMTSGPATAGFTDYGDGSGQFNWIPVSIGDIGQHDVVFEASDGETNATTSVSVSVSSFGVNKPAGGSLRRPGSNIRVTWSGSFALGTVNIDLWRGDTLVANLATGAAAGQAAANWNGTLPRQLGSGNNYWVSVEDADNPDDVALSAFFRIMRLNPTDYDGDGMADATYFTVGPSAFHIARSSLGVLEQVWGLYTTDRAVAGDFDGDGYADLAVYEANGTWHLARTSLGYAGLQLGGAGDIPVARDYDGDGATDMAIYQPHNGTWHVSGTQVGYFGLVWGVPGDIPVPADYDGDGFCDIAFFRPSNQTWYIHATQAGDYSVKWGLLPTDQPVPADYDGDGYADIAVYQQNGTWHLARTSAGYAGLQLGGPGDIPVPADYDADGADDMAIYQPHNGTWHISRTRDGYIGFVWGGGGAVPVR